MARKPKPKPKPRRTAPAADRLGDGKFAPGNTHGGARENAGRKPAAIRQAEEALWAAHDLDETAVVRLKELIGDENGSVAVHAIKLYLERRYGKARVSIDLKTSGSHVLDTLDIFRASQIATMAKAAKKQHTNTEPTP